MTDEAGVLSANQRTMISRELAAFENRTGHQMVVVTVKSLEGRDVADFTRDLANAWAIGRNCYNDGITFLVAPKEHKVRIAVGFGLEHTLTDEVSRRILDEKVLPAFRQGNLPAGIEAGTKALMKAAS